MSNFRYTEHALEEASRQRDELRECAIGLRSHAGNVNVPRHTRDAIYRGAASMERAADTISALLSVVQFGDADGDAE